MARLQWGMTLLSKFNNTAPSGIPLNIHFRGDRKR